jgi:hypothetical protein
LSGKGTVFKPDEEDFTVNKTCYLKLAKTGVTITMKKIIVVLVVGKFLSCGNQSAENQPTDLDRTKNNDTSAVSIDSSKMIQSDGTDTSRLNK